MLPSHLQNLIFQFTRLPGIGPRQAARFAFYLLRNPLEINALESVLAQVRANINLCRNCFLPANVSPPQDTACNICANPRRDKNLVCIVEKETDAINLEKTRQFQGHYFVLGGFIDPLEKPARQTSQPGVAGGESLAYARLDTFLKKMQDCAGETRVEIILALTPRREGDFTSFYIEEQFKPFANIKITRLGRGLSSGAELEYADEETLKNALDGRK